LNDMSNPYAPPVARLDGGGDVNDCWREDKKVVRVYRGSDLPPRCVKCNAPAVVYLLLLLNLLIYAVVAAITRKRFDVSPGLCATHKASRGRKVMAAWALFLVGLGLVFVVAETGNDAAIIAMIVTLLASIVMAVVVGRIVYPIEITPEYARLRGFGAPFLAALPPRPLRMR